MYGFVIKKANIFLLIGKEGHKDGVVPLFASLPKEGHSVRAQVHPLCHCHCLSLIQHDQHVCRTDAYCRRNQTPKRSSRGQEGTGSHITFGARRVTDCCDCSVWQMVMPRSKPQQRSRVCFIKAASVIVVGGHCRAEAIVPPSCGPLVARQTAPNGHKKVRRRPVVSVYVFFGHRKKVNGVPEEEKQNGQAPVEFVHFSDVLLVTGTIITSS